MSHPQPIEFQGQPISLKGEAMSLTDMWKAAGSPANREPFNWARKEGSSFIAAVALAHNLPDGQVLTTKRGKGGATFAHWQVGLAYAKYLSDEFHMWCNSVVRAVMERGARAGLPSDLEALIRRDDGIVRMLAHKVTEIERALPAVAGGIERLTRSVSDLISSADPRVAVIDYISVRGLLDDAGAIRKGRNKLNRKVGHELRDRVMTSEPRVSARRCLHSNVWLFPRDFADAYMSERGKSLVKQHNDRQRGQLHLLEGSKA